MAFESATIALTFDAGSSEALLALRPGGKSPSELLDQSRLSRLRLTMFIEIDIPEDTILSVNEFTNFLFAM